jgi:hypothetical protein
MAGNHSGLRGCQPWPRGATAPPREGTDGMKVSQGSHSPAGQSAGQPPGRYAGHEATMQHYREGDDRFWVLASAPADAVRAAGTLS